MLDFDPSSTTVITVNSRLSRWLLLNFHQTQKDQGKVIWDTPKVIPLTAWLNQVRNDSWPERPILSKVQAIKLWESIIQKDPETPHQEWLRLRGIAEEASKAYSLIQNYRIPINLLDSHFASLEVLSFLRWTRVYEAQLELLNACAPECLLELVRSGIEAKRVSIPKAFVFAGFDEIFPQLEELLKTLSGLGSKVSFYPDKPELKFEHPDTLTFSENTHLYSFPDPQQEVIQCARWIRKVFQPGKTVGVVVSDLNQYLDIIMKEFSAELKPDSVFPWSGQDMPFNISLGTSLGQQPLVSTALQFLKADTSPLPLILLGNIFNTPLIQESHNEETERLKILKRFKRNKQIQVSWQELSGNILETRCPQLSGIFNHWKQFCQNTDKSLPSEWARTIHNFLRDIGWPGKDCPNSESLYQIQESFKENLDSLSSLDQIMGKLSRSEAVRILEQSIEDTVFQVKSRETPIQVVGLLESAGMEFDHLWVMGCHSEALPAIPSPSPFIPVEMQKRFQLPHSNSHRELQFAVQIVHRLTKASPQIIFSYPEQDQTTELQASSLLKKLSPVDLNNPLSHRFQDQFPPENLLIELEESGTIPLDAHVLENPFPGGYSILKDQSDCPFRAFAKYRLRVPDPTIPELDFESAERGTLIHKIMEYFWERVKSKSGLLELKNSGRVKETVKSCIDLALKENSSGMLPKQPGFMGLERSTLITRIMNWLDVEENQPDFTVVHMEKREILEIGNLKLVTRADRLDQRVNGEWVLIDYKTGNIRTTDWFSDPLQETQLPLYAIKLNPVEVVVALLNQEKLEWKKVFHADMKSKKMKGSQEKELDFSNTLDYWTVQLNQLADNFVRGELKINPYKPYTCRYCHIKPLCRINEIEPEIEDEDPES